MIYTSQCMTYIGLKHVTMIHTIAGLLFPHREAKMEACHNDTRYNDTRHNETWHNSRPVQRAYLPCTDVQLVL